VPFVIALIVLGFLILALVLRFATEPGPTAGEVAVAYETAWDHLDFDSLWELSAEELRDGRDRAAFVAAKRAAFTGQPPLDRLTGHVGVEEVVLEGRRAQVRTSLALRAGGRVASNVTLERRNGRWQVVAYTLADSDADVLEAGRWS